MKLLRKSGRAALCFLLSATLLLSLVLLQAAATAADDQEKELLGTLSASYEAGSPGTISSGSGDAGGKSYGSYQFSSTSDVPKSFFEWCLGSDDTYYQSIGSRLSEAYYTGTPGYGTLFDATWKALASENSAGFEQAQRNYVRLRYYDPIVARIEKNHPGFDIDNYSIALRNVLWSRAVQLGTGGAASMMDYAFTALGGFANQNEADIIQAIYAECSEVRAPKAGESTMSGSTAEKYGVAGKVLSWFSGNSGDVQLGVYLRLGINEPARAQNMLATYGYADAPLDEGLYQFSPAGSTALAAVAKDSGVTLNTAVETDAQRFRLTYYASGYYIIESVSTGKRLAARSDGTVLLADADAGNEQMWKLESLGSGFSLCNRGTGQYLSAASVSAGGQLSLASTALQWQLVKSGAAWSLEGASYPTYANILLEGESNFPFRGTLRCTYPIQTVKVSILNAAGSNAISPASASNINAKAYDLSDLDNAVAFSRLSAGGYKLIIEATSSAAGSGTYRLESDFYVSDGSYRLTFDACGGTASESVRNVAAGQAYGDLPTASKSGYLFIGWFTQQEGGTQVSPSDTVIAADRTLYAHYEKAYTYAFRNYDGTTLASGELAAGQVIPAPKHTPTRPADGVNYYTFLGWAGYSEGMTISADVVFTARYETHILSLLPEISTDAYTISDGYLRAISTGTSVSAVLENLVPNEYITIYKGDEAATGLAGTGMTVEYTAFGQVKQNLTMVVTGDLNGDGKCTLTDMVQLQFHLLERQSLTGASLQAADMNGDGRVSITDMVQITSVLLGKSSITPN